MFSQPRHCDVAVVCTLPLSDVGLWQPAESVYLSVRRHSRWPVRPASPKRSSALLDPVFSTNPSSRKASRARRPASVSAHLTQPKPCGVTQVCTLPLSALGPRQPAGALASRGAGDNATPGRPARGWRPAPSTPVDPGLLQRTWLSPLLTLAVPPSVPGLSRCYRSTRHCDVAVVCTLPLPGFGFWQPAGSDDFPERRSFASRCGRATRLLDKARLHPHRAPLVQLQRVAIFIACLPSRSRYRPRPISGISQPRHCGVSVVCTLPLPGYGI
jgi:hypothetical protein